jgi:hypothetical protein
MIRGRRRALVAVGNSIPTIARRLLPGPAARTFSDLGSDWHDRIAPLLSSDFNSGLDREEEFAALRMGRCAGQDRGTHACGRARTEANCN